MAVEKLKNMPIVIGAKQTTKALQKNQISVLYIAKDAESRITEPLVNIAQEKGVQVIKVPTMKELGKAVGIEVSAASAGVLAES